MYALHSGGKATKSPSFVVSFYEILKNVFLILSGTAVTSVDSLTWYQVTGYHHWFRQSGNVAYGIVTKKLQKLINQTLKQTKISTGL